MGRCDGCRFWTGQPSNAFYRPDWRLCGRANRTVDGSRPLVVTGVSWSQSDPIMVTAPEFGCNQFEART